MNLVFLVLLGFLASPPLLDPLCIQRTTTRRILGAGMGGGAAHTMGPCVGGGHSLLAPLAGEPEVALCRISNLLGGGSH